MGSPFFPFNTCEKPNEDGIAQPYSCLCNLINCIIIFYFLLKTKHNYTFILLFSILCFQLFHLFSHMIHIKGLIQTYIIHILAYSINLSFLYALYSYTHKFPSNIFIVYLLILVCFDIYSLFNLSLVVYILTQATIIVSLLVYYFKLLPKFIQSTIYNIVFFAIIVILLVVNEKFNCEKMMSIYPHFPYHIFIEIMGIVLFYIICSNFYKL